MNPHPLPSPLRHISTRGPQRDYWSAIARHWDLLGPPLRPSEQDLRFCQNAIELLAAHDPLRATILGVTPELFHLAWPPAAEVIAVDRSQGMIDAIWPGPSDATCCGEWTALPLEDGSRELVLCDGGAITLGYPHGLSRLARELSRVLVPGGLCLIRTFIRPLQREAVGDVLRDLLAGEVPNTNVLKLRLGMALQADVQDGVPLAEIWQTLHCVAPDLLGLAEQIGWPAEPLRAIDAYRDCGNRYAFHSLDEFLSPFIERSGGFAVKSIQTPTYSLGERCPTVIFRRDESPHEARAQDASIVPAPHAQFHRVASRECQ